MNRNIAVAAACVACGAVGFALGALSVQRMVITLPERPQEEPVAARAESPETAPESSEPSAPPQEEQQPRTPVAPLESTASGTTPEQKIDEVKDEIARLNPRASYGDWGRASAAILSLVGEESGVVDTQLYEWAQSGNRMVMFPAASALEQRGDPREAQRLIQQSAEKMELPNDEETRFRAVNDISRLRTPLALPYLERAAGDPSPAVRLVVAQALAYVRSDGVVPIARSLLNDESDQVRQAARDALSRAGVR